MTISNRLSKSLKKSHSLVLFIFLFFSYTAVAANTFIAKDTVKVIAVTENSENFIFWPSTDITSIGLSRWSEITKVCSGLYRYSFLSIKTSI